MARERQAEREDIAPVKTTAHGPNRSENPPHIMLVNAIAKEKPMVIALDTRSPTSRCRGRSAASRTGNENIAPIATQPNRPPAATIPQLIASFGHHPPYQLVGISVKRPAAARLFGPAEQSATSITSS